jgi:Flp pilus assembly protein CpaB
MTRPDSAGGVEPVRLPRRRWWTRVSGAQLVMVIAGTLAFLVNLTVLRARDDFVLVAVAAEDINPGIILDVSRHVELVELDAGSELVAPALARERLSEVEGMVVTAALRRGDLINASHLRPAAAPADRRAMSLPVDAANAAGGRIGVGDRIDVIAVDDGAARYVLVGAEVIGRSEEGGATSIAGSRAFFVVVAVDAVQALELAAAMDTSEIQVVRSTGASPPEHTELDVVRESEDHGGIDR